MIFVTNTAPGLSGAVATMPDDMGWGGFADLLAEPAAPDAARPDAPPDAPPDTPLSGMTQPLLAVSWINRAPPWGGDGTERDATDGAAGRMPGAAEGIPPEKAGPSDPALPQVGPSVEGNEPAEATGIGTDRRREPLSRSGEPTEQDGPPGAERGGGQAPDVPHYAERSGRSAPDRPQTGSLTGGPLANEEPPVSPVTPRADMQPATPDTALNADPDRADTRPAGPQNGQDSLPAEGGGNGSRAIAATGAAPDAAGSAGRPDPPATGNASVQGALEGDRPPPVAPPPDTPRHLHAPVDAAMVALPSVPPNGTTHALASLLDPLARRETAPVPPADLSPLVLRALEAKSDGALELTLSPKELGPLRIEFLQGPDGLRVTLSAERSEAMDLMRRHAAELLAELRQAGWAQASLGFADWAQGQRERDRGAGPLARSAPEGDIDTTPPLPAGQTVATGGTHARLDLRL